MKLDRNIAIIRSMLRTAMENDDQEAQIRLFGLLTMQYADHKLELDKKIARLEFVERRKQRRVA